MSDGLGIDTTLADNRAAVKVVVASIFSSVRPSVAIAALAGEDALDANLGCLLDLARSNFAFAAPDDPSLCRCHDVSPWLGFLRLVDSYIGTLFRIVNNYFHIFAK